MRLQGFTGIEKSFTIIDNDIDIEVDYCDYSYNDNQIVVHDVECDVDVDLNALEIAMNEYAYWSIIEQDALDNHNQSDEDYSRENY